MKIEFPVNFSLNSLDKTYLWRYISLSKLLDLMNNKFVYFTRFDDFEDGLEGITGRSVTLKAFVSGEPLTVENTRHLEKDNQSKLLNYYENSRLEYLDNLEKTQQTQFASCWYLGDRESIAMWKIYSQREGVAIKFKARELTDTIIAGAKSHTNTDFEVMYYGPVEYKNIWPFDAGEVFHNEFNGLKKDKSYLHENEFRFVSVVKSIHKGKHRDFRLFIGPLESYELEIITNPFMKEWEYQNLKTLLSKYNLSDKLRPSQMVVKKI
jgi:hypothetical protein